MAHELRLLSRLGHIRVEQCSCGAVHLHVGSITMRLEPEKAHDLARALSSAAKEFTPLEATVTAASSLAASEDSGSSDPEGGQGPSDPTQLH